MVYAPHLWVLREGLADDLCMNCCVVHRAVCVAHLAGVVSEQTERPSALRKRVTEGDSYRTSTKMDQLTADLCPDEVPPSDFAIRRKGAGCRYFRLPGCDEDAISIAASDTHFRDSVGVSVSLASVTGL